MKRLVQAEEEKLGLLLLCRLQMSRKELLSDVHAQLERSHELLLVSGSRLPCIES